MPKRGGVNLMAIFKPKDKRKHYTKRAKDESLTPEQRAYAKGQRDARNESMISYLLGKNSPLSADEKAKMKEAQKAKRAEYQRNKKNKGDK